MTLSQIRNQVRALQRKYAKELAVYRLRRMAEEIFHDWNATVADGNEAPESHTVIWRIAQRGFRLYTYTSLHHYLTKCKEAGKSPEPRQIVSVLLPWAETGGYLEGFRWDMPAQDCSPSPLRFT